MLPDSSLSRFLGWSWAYVKWAEGVIRDLFYFQALLFMKYLLAGPFLTFSPTMLTALWLLMSTIQLSVNRGGRVGGITKGD